jgi:hypothetical protein
VHVDWLSGPLCQGVRRAIPLVVVEPRYFELGKLRGAAQSESTSRYEGSSDMSGL